RNRICCTRSTRIIGRSFQVSRVQDKIAQTVCRSLENHLGFRFSGKNSPAVQQVDLALSNSTQVVSDKIDRESTLIDSNTRGSTLLGSEATAHSRGKGHKQRSVEGITPRGGADSRGPAQDAQ